MYIKGKRVTREMRYCPSETKGIIYMWSLSGWARSPINILSYFCCGERHEYLGKLIRDVLRAVCIQGHWIARQEKMQPCLRDINAR